MKVAIYARVSTHEQTAENQLIELRRYCEARGWTAMEYVDEGVSGSKDRRPALDELIADVKAHRVKGWSVGDWIGWGAICAIWSCSSMSGKPLELYSSA